MRLISTLAILILSYQLASAAPPLGPAPPMPPGEDISVPQQDTRLVVVDFRIVDSVDGKEQSSATTKVAVPIGQTGELSIGNNIPGAPAQEGQPAKDQFVGTKVMVTPILRNDGRVQMTFKLRISQLAKGTAPDGSPKLDIREGTTNAVASPGQAVPVSNFKIGDTETRISAVPRIMDASAAMKAAAPNR